MVGESAPGHPKLNNNFRAHFARLIAEQEPDLRDAFRTRALATSHHRVP